ERVASRCAWCASLRGRVQKARSLTMTTTTFSIWYMRPEFFRDGILGVEWLRSQGRMPNPEALEHTHIHLKDLCLAGGRDQLEQVFHDMQGEVWSPNGEARALIISKGLAHTSMSVGDVVVVEGDASIVDTFGFSLLCNEVP